MRTGKIRVKTLVKFLDLYNLARDKGRPLTVNEVVDRIKCCRGHAYNYVRAVERLLSSTLA